MIFLIHHNLLFYSSSQQQKKPLDFSRGFFAIHWIWLDKRAEILKRNTPREIQRPIGLCCKRGGIAPQGLQLWLRDNMLAEPCTQAQVCDGRVDCSAIARNGLQVRINRNGTEVTVGIMEPAFPGCKHHQPF